MKKEIAITPNQIKQSINDLLDEVEYWQKQSTEANKRIDKAIFFLNNECMYSKDLGYCDDLWCGRVKDLVNILKGEDE